MRVNKIIGEVLKTYLRRPFNSESFLKSGSSEAESGAISANFLFLEGWPFSTVGIETSVWGVLLDSVIDGAIGWALASATTEAGVISWRGMFDRGTNDEQVGRVSSGRGVSVGRGVFDGGVNDGRVSSGRGVSVGRWIDERANADEPLESDASIDDCGDCSGTGESIIFASHHRDGYCSRICSQSSFGFCILNSILVDLPTRL